MTISSKEVAAIIFKNMDKKERDLLTKIMNTSEEKITDQLGDSKENIIRNFMKALTNREMKASNERIAKKMATVL